MSAPDIRTSAPTAPQTSAGGATGATGGAPKDPGGGASQGS